MNHFLDVTLRSIFVNQWASVGIVSVLLLFFAEAGFRYGTRLFAAKDTGRMAQIGSIQGAVLGLLALLIGFTFSMAVARYDLRRDLVVQEANSIGTTYLRASFLPEAHRSAVEADLRRYVGARLAFFEAGRDTSAIDAAQAEATALQRDMWAHTVAAAADSPTPVMATFITTLNETIDLSSNRLYAMEQKVPSSVWLLVLFVACVGCLISGCAAGTNGARLTFSNLVLPLLIAVVLTLVSDFDRPRNGLVTISQQPLIDLKASLQ